LSEPVADFCPVCGARTEPRMHDHRLRPVCLNCEHVVYFDPKVAAVAFITRGDEVLLTQRTYDPFGGLWVVPGGFVERGEDPRQTAHREVYEETGLEVRIGALLDVFHVGDGDAVIVIAYAATVTGGTVRLNEELSALEWFRRDNLPELAFISTITLVNRWARGEL
jgi:ADP-ribose pyrophosphatase YjhB (NUDIX family)